MRLRQRLRQALHRGKSPSRQSKRPRGAQGRSGRPRDLRLPTARTDPANSAANWPATFSAVPGTAQKLPMRCGSFPRWQNRGCEDGWARQGLVGVQRQALVGRYSRPLRTPHLRSRSAEGSTRRQGEPVHRRPAAFVVAGGVREIVGAVEPARAEHAGAVAEYAEAREARRRRPGTRQWRGRPRETHFWSCKRHLSSADYPVCERCGWIRCPCGVCSRGCVPGLR